MSSSSDSDEEENKEEKVRRKLSRDASGFMFTKKKAQEIEERHVANIDLTSEWYKMDHERRGVAVIFNHKNFEGYLGVRKRRGTDRDCERIEEVMVKLGFEVEVLKDATGQQIRDKFEKISELDHTNCDCVWIIVLTHGKNGQLYAKDTTYPIDMILHYLSLDKCPTLAGKPKLLTFQACQGDNVDLGHPVNLTVETDSKQIIRHSIPTKADFLLLHSSAPGYVSYRDTKEGSWFVRELCENLENYAYTLDIFTLMTRVARQVAFQKRTDSTDHPSRDEKQMPYFTSTLTKVLKFKPPSK